MHGKIKGVAYSKENCIGASVLQDKRHGTVQVNVCKQQERPLVQFARPDAAGDDAVVCVEGSGKKKGRKLRVGQQDDFGDVHQVVRRVQVEGDEGGAVRDVHETDALYVAHSFAIAHSGLSMVLHLSIPKGSQGR